MKLIPYRENLCSKYATKMLSIKINNRCNCFCGFCVDRGGRCSGGQINVGGIAENAISYRDYETVIITGGEPFLNFNEVVKLATKLRSFKKRIVLNTNGSLLSPEKVQSLNGLIDELQVSVHHYDEMKNAEVFGRHISFNDIRKALESKAFLASINSTFNKGYTDEEKPEAIDKMVELVKYLGADKLRLTELKKVKEADFVLAGEFFPRNHPFVGRSSDDLITKGCTYYYNQDGIEVSVKRLCEYAKGENAPAFSCCFININGQMKIDVETADTFKVIYSDAKVTNDWIFEGIKN